jgi:hypothetical protein
VYIARRINRTDDSELLVRMLSFRTLLGWERADRIYALIKQTEWKACLEEIPNASTEEIGFKDFVSLGKSIFP